MSEEAKLAYLQEKIRDAKRNERTGMTGLVIGALFVALGVFFIILWRNDFTMASSLVLIMLGIVALGLGFYMSGHYADQYKNLMKELESIATSLPKCSKCGKELPKGSFDFCPFCGDSLKP